MNHITKKYRSIVYLLPLVYIFSFLLSPYFHFHAEELIHNDHHRFHSHIFEGSHDDHSGEDAHSHNLDESSDHDLHLAKLNGSTTLLTKRGVQNYFAVITLNFSSTEQPNYLKSIFEKKPINFLLRDRCVQTATNVSPPLA